MKKKLRNLNPFDDIGELDTRRDPTDYRQPDHDSRDDTIDRPVSGPSEPGGEPQGDGPEPSNHSTPNHNPANRPNPRR